MLLLSLRSQRRSLAKLPMRRASVTVALVAVVLVGTISVGVAQASSLSWSSSITVAPEGVMLSAVSCPATSLCVAVGAEYVVTSTDPVGGAAAWTASTLDTSGEPLLSVSCPTASFCVAADAEGAVFTSTDPTGGSSAWTLAAAGVSGPSLSCPTTSFCASAGAGDIVISTDPTGGASAWHSVSVDPDNRLSAISCASASLCVAVDAYGKELHSTDPTGGASAWSSPEAIAARADGISESLNSITCPTSSFCAATDGSDYLISEGYSTGDVVTTTDPTGGASAWTVSAPLDTGLFPIACPSTSFCVTSDLEHSVYESSEPSNPSSWQTSTIDTGTGGPSGLACPSSELCVATYGDYGEGYLLVGTRTVGAGSEEEHPTSKHEEPSPPSGNGGSGNSSSSTSRSTTTTTPPSLPATVSSAQIITALDTLIPSGKADTTSALLKHDGLTILFTAPEAGTLSVQWYAASGATTASHRKTKPLLVASGQTSFAASGRGTVRIKLTGAGKQLLRHTKRIKVAVKGVFTPKGGVAISGTKQVVV
jgi:hypothetical protein